MGALEISLLIIGGIIFVLSFLLPSGNRAADAETRGAVQEEVKNTVAREMDGVKGRIEDIVDETVSYAVEKTERSLERVSNEKIMAVSEYSDTVLEDINKNHKEVMFLYDMLNDKHQNIKDTVSEVEKTVKDVKKKADRTVKELEEAEKEETAKNVIKRERAEAYSQKDFPKEEEKGIQDFEADEDFSVLIPQRISEKNPPENAVKSTAVKASAPDISFMKGSRKSGNHNERILRLHSEGKSNMAIAKELGLGVGEVKLVIDLFEGV